MVTEGMSERSELSEPRITQSAKRNRLKKETSRFTVVACVLFVTFDVTKKKVTIDIDRQARHHATNTLAILFARHCLQAFEKNLRWAIRFSSTLDPT